MRGHGRTEILGATVTIGECIERAAAQVNRDGWGSSADYTQKVATHVATHVKRQVLIAERERYARRIARLRARIVELEAGRA